jgi:hypothetical protein
MGWSADARFPNGFRYLDDSWANAPDEA